MKELKDGQSIEGRDSLAAIPTTVMILRALVGVIGSGLYMWVLYDLKIHGWNHSDGGEAQAVAEGITSIIAFWVGFPAVLTVIALGLSKKLGSVLVTIHDVVLCTALVLAALHDKSGLTMIFAIPLIYEAIAMVFFLVAS